MATTTTTTESRLMYGRHLLWELWIGKGSHYIFISMLIAFAVASFNIVCVCECVFARCKKIEIEPRALILQ